MTNAATITNIIHDPTKRHDFVLLFDIRDGNPNGDPDAGNMPRIDPETMQGLVTAESIKRKVRDYVDITEGDDRFKIYVQHGEFLADRRRSAIEKHGAPDDTPPKQAADWMCAEFFDIRMFGAVMSFKSANAGQVRGPMQIAHARSVDPIVWIDHSITGPAQNRTDVMRGRDPNAGEQDAPGEDEADSEAPVYGTMGRRSTVAYGLYRTSGIFNTHFAGRTKANGADLDIFWRSLDMMWDLDRSSARGDMACRGLYVFSHDSPYGNAPAHRLLDLISVPPSGNAAPRSFSDYTVTRPPDGALEQFPGVTLTSLTD